MKVVVSTESLRRMRAHGEETYPFECCGFLLGSAEDGVQRVLDVRSQSNERTESKGEALSHLTGSVQGR